MIRAIRLGASVNRVLNDYGLKDKALIGRGAFSLVYDGGKASVYKLTVDGYSYGLMKNATGRHFPKIRRDYGIVGEIAINNIQHHLYLMKMERLQKLQAGGNARLQAMTITQSVSKYVRLSLAIQMIEHDKTFPKSILQALWQVQQYQVFSQENVLDMHMANFMQRESGTLIITDPLLDRPVWRARVDEERRKYGNADTPALIA